MHISRISKCFQVEKIKLFQQIYPLTLSRQLASYLGHWEIPTGYDTGISIYNSAANKRVPLILRRKGLATWYMCGPTVYAESHIGHAVCFIKFDIIRRILEKVFNINVILLQGVTDIDDKIIKKSNEMGVSALQLARKYELEFFKDMENLKVLPPTIISRVSENILLIISFCEKLIQKGFAYATTEGNVYFRVSKGVTSDVLNEISNEINLSTNIDPLKEDPRDFALWKASKPNEPSWESPWGKGRPGWHIECSVMASKVFGSQLDIHSGGYDLLFPHHTNEKSQSEAYHGCTQWVNYWIHSGLLHVADDLKMSKSLGNTISIEDFLKEHCTNDLRIICLQSLYRKNLSYNSEILTGAISLHKKLHHFINDCESYINGEIIGDISNLKELNSKLVIAKDKVVEFFANDFNTSQALLFVTDFIDDVNKCLSSLNTSQSATSSSISFIATSYLFVNNFLEMLGIDVISKQKLPSKIVFTINAAVLFRNKIRLLAMPQSRISLKIEDDISYLDEAYNYFNLEMDLIFKLSECPKYITEISELTHVIYQKAHHFVQQMDKKNLSQEKIETKEMKKKMSPLFTICDEFRSNLQHYGIAIKDKGSNSFWIPLVQIPKVINEQN